MSTTAPNTSVNFLFCKLILVIASGFPCVSHAELINNSYWLVKPGESLYSIARKIFPGKTRQQARLRKEIQILNPEVFAEGANRMKINSKLTLPEFAVKKEKAIVRPAVIVKKTPKPEPAKSIKVAAVTEDPADTIGKVVINIGKLKAENRGSLRNLKRNSRILKGDILRTSSKTHTQIRFIDGALVSLRPNTEFHIEEYAFNGREDGSERTIFNLIKGGFRTITGLIGHKNKQNYQVKTTVATIGIRGTHYGLLLCTSGSCQQDANNLEDGLYGGVVDGQVVTENDSGVHQISNDEYFHIASQYAPPRIQLKPPPVFHALHTPEPERGGDEEDDGDRPHQPERMANRPPMRPHIPVSDPDFRPPRPQELPPPEISDPVQTAPNGSGMAVSFLERVNTSITNGVGAPVIISSNNNNRIFLSELTLPNGTVIGGVPFGGHEQSIDQELGTLVSHDVAIKRPDGTGANLVSLNSNAALDVMWGRWQGSFVALEDGQPMAHTNNFHFVYSDNLTPLTSMAALGGIRTRAELYKLDNGTLPTDHLGTVAGSLPSIVTSFDFVSGEMTNYLASVAVGGTVYSAGSGPVAFNQLGDSFNISGNGCQSGTCDGEASIIFVGSVAGGAMTSYAIHDANGLGGVSGAGLLRPITDPIAPNGAGMLYAFSGPSNGIFSGVAVTAPNRTDNIYTTGVIDSTSNPHTVPIVVHESNPLPALGARDIFLNSTNTQNDLINVDFGSASQVTGSLGTANVTVNWGRWDANAVTVLEAGQPIQNHDLHYISSTGLTPLSDIMEGAGGRLATLYGTAVAYTTVGGTLPTDNLGGEGTVPGGNVNVSADFATQTLNYSVSATTPNMSFNVQTTGASFASIPNGIQLQEIPTGSCTSGGGLCSGTALLNFIGPDAEGAITSYVIGESDGSRIISGTSLLDSGGP